MKKIVVTLSALLFLCFQMEAKKIKNKMVLMETTMGNIKLELYADVPQHSENFLKLVKEGFYDSLLFHRVIPSFMIQGGDPQSKNAPDGQMLGNGDVGYRVPAEFMVEKYYHKKGALAAARDNNPDKASSGCQFYIVVGKKYTDEELNQVEARNGFKYSEQARNDYKTVGGTPFLDNGYTVYGQLLEGQDVVDAIANVERSAGDRPNVNVRVLTAKIVKK